MGNPMAFDLIGETQARAPLKRAAPVTSEGALPARLPVEPPALVEPDAALAQPAPARPSAPLDDMPAPMAEALAPANAATSAPLVSTATSVAADAARLSSRITHLRRSLFAPDGGKTFRPLPSGEVARLLGVSDSYLRHLARTGEGPDPDKVGGRRLYSLDQVAALRDAIHAKGGSRLSTAGWPTRERGREHCQTIAVANFKGGSGKTTTAAHLAQYLALRGYRVLAVDLDPQASLSALFGHQPETDVGEGDTLYGAIRYADPRPTREVVRPTYVRGLDLIPGNLELHEFEHDTPRALAAGANGGTPFFARVAEAIAQVSDDYDVVVLDCPPQLGFLTLGALCAATGVVVTVHPQMLDIASMSQFLNMTADLMGVVEEAGATPRLDFMRYLVTRHEPQDGPQGQVIGFLRTLFAERVLTHAMVKSAAVSDAGLSKQTLYEVPREAMDRRTHDRARASLDAVNGEIEGLMRAAWGRA